MDKAQKELQLLRKKIDALDKDLLTNLRKRFKVVKKISKLKQNLKLSPHQKGRWEEMLKERINLSKTLKLDDKFTRSIFTIIHKESKRLQSLKRKEGKK